MPAVRINKTSDPTRRLVNTAIETGRVAYLPPDALPNTALMMLKAISCFCLRHPELVRDRGFRIRCRRAADGGLRVWAERL